jgi:DNA-binding beta-propeller fold protein YncE
MRRLGPALLGLLLTLPGPVQAVRFVARPDQSLYASPEEPGFRRPHGVSTDPFGNLFVADTGNHRVVHFDSKGRYVFEYGGYGWREGELSEPSDVTAREGFRLFVVDEGNERIQEFDIGDTSPEGTVFPFGEGGGLGDQELVSPSRIEVDREGRIYVSDALCHCVWIFTPTGALYGKLGGLGESPTHFRDPGGVAVGPKGRVFVADSGNARVQVYDAIGNWIAVWNGTADDPLGRPVGIDVDANGQVYVADAARGEIRVFTAEGVPLFRFGTFRAPVDVAVGPDGRVWVVDQERETVEGFSIVRVDDEEP